MKKELVVPYHHQEKWYTCGPAILRMMYDFFGMHFPEGAIAHEVHTNTKVGTTHSALITSVRKHGLYCYVHDKSSVEHIKHFVQSGFPVVVNFYEEGNGHYGVVVGYTSQKFILNDPWMGKEYHMTFDFFEKNWKYYVKDEGRSNRWIMVLSKDKFAVGKQYYPLGLPQE